MPFRKFADEEVQDIIKRYTKDDQGLTHIGNVYEAGQATIKRVLEENGVEIRKNGKVSGKGWGKLYGLK